eukprot:738566-Pyramimonas_sp.AAC.2
MFAETSWQLDSFSPTWVRQSAQLGSAVRAEIAAFNCIVHVSLICYGQPQPPRYVQIRPIATPHLPIHPRARTPACRPARSHTCRCTQAENQRMKIDIMTLKRRLRDCHS